jgi:hypothetical protein
VPYRWFLVPDYKENESIIIFLFNHSFQDGVALVSML